MARPIVRNALNNAWVDVFCKGGWKMKMPDGSFLTLTALNTKMRNPENTGWVDFYCPIAPPKTVTGGSVRSNRLVDTAGFLWGAGPATNVYEDDSTSSTTWQKIKYNDATSGHGYINNIKSMDCRDALYVLLNNGKVIVSGEYYFGLWATGSSGASGSTLKTSWGLDQTNNWEFKLGAGNVANIAQITGDGCLIMNNGLAYSVGKAYYEYTPPFTGATGTKEYGFLGAGIVNSTFSYGIDTKAGAVTQWSRLLYSNDRTNSQPLSGIVSMAKTANGIAFALRDDGKLFQAPYWFAYGSRQYTYPNGMPNPLGRYDSMFDGLLPASGKPVFLHPGAVLETDNGILYYPKRKMHGNGDYFYDFEWIDSGINLNNLGAKMKRVVGYINEDRQYAAVYSIFILLEDGRLYASGDNANGWFGIGSATKSVALNTPRLINSNVADFDSFAQSTIAMKKDGTMWACGSNASSRLGLGPNMTASVYYDWQQCVFTSL